MVMSFIWTLTSEKKKTKKNSEEQIINKNNVTADQIVTKKNPRSTSPTSPLIRDLLRWLSRVGNCPRSWNSNCG
jgi:hypothetical protein